MISKEFINVNATALTGYEVPADTWDSISAMRNAERRHTGVERTVTLGKLNDIRHFLLNVNQRL